MASSKSILILVNTPGFDIENPNSAVANFIKMIVGFIEEESLYKVDVQSFGSKPTSSTKVTSETLKSKPSPLKKYLKKYAIYFYNSLVANKLFAFQETQFEKLKDKHFDLIIEFYTVGSQLGKKLKEVSGAKYLMIYDCPVLEQFIEMNGGGSIFSNKMKAAEKNSVLAADHIWCYSPYVKNYLVTNYHYKGEFLISPCIVWKKAQHAYLENKQEVIGFVGSFLKWHKVDLLIKAFSSLGAEFQSLKMILVGYGEEWESVKESRDQSKFKDRIQMTGYVSDEELEKLKSTFTIGVMPGSNWYGSPLKLFEYAQSGIPIVAPSSPVVLDLFTHNETCLFIDPKNEVVSLAEQIKKLIVNKELAARLVANAEKLMESVYSKSHQKQKLNDIITKLVDSNDLKK